MTLRTATLSRLFVYPIKAAAGIELQHAALDDFGIEHDRRFLIVDRNARFMTQREFPRMALIHLSFDTDSLVLSTRAAPTIAVPLRPTSAARIRVVIWDDTVDAIYVDDAVDDWLTNVLGTPCRLVYMPADVVRPVPAGYSVRNDRTTFTDAFPLLILSQASLDALNGRLAEPVDVRRFRPNLLIGGVAAHDEDTWARVRIGTLDVHVVKPCARCAVTTVDPDTGVRGKEPLRTLAQYRTRNGKVYFAQNAIHAGPGEVSVGDAVEVLETRAAYSLSPEAGSVSDVAFLRDGLSL